MLSSLIPAWEQRAVRWRRKSAIGFTLDPIMESITLLLERAEKEDWPCKFVQLDQTKYWLSECQLRISWTRYLFTGCGAFGKRRFSSDLGTEFTDPVRLQLPQPQRIEQWLARRDYSR